MLNVKTHENVRILQGLQRTPTRRVVLLHSGGVDSTGTGCLLADQGYQIYPLVINYRQPCWEAEWWAANKTAQHLCWHQPLAFTCDLSPLVVSGLTGTGAETASQAWVPARNTFFMVLGAMYACAEEIDADGIAIGYMIDDNFVYGDNGYVHHQMASALLSLSLSRPLGVYHPGQGKKKREIITFLKECDVYEQTVSCWNAKVIDNKLFQCQQCDNCLERHREEQAIEIEEGELSAT